MSEETKRSPIPAEAEEPEQEDALLPAETEEPEDAPDGYETGEDPDDEGGYDDDYEDGDDDSLVVTTATTIDGPLLDTMVEIMARQTKKSIRRNYLICAVVAAVAAVACLLMSQSLAGLLLLVVAVFMGQSYLTTSKKSARKRLNKFEGQVWDYTFAVDGIHVGKSVTDACVPWGTVRKAWLEGDFYVFDVKNSSIVIRRSILTDSQRNALELLMLEHVSECTL